jgi:hypothetical protein
MKQRTGIALVTALVAATGWSQEISVQGITIAQMWKQETPGFDKATYTPATQYLGIDATKLGTDKLSLHLFGWGHADLGDSSVLGGFKSGGYLSYGYLQYQFDKANAELKAGRFAVNQGTGFEQVDGVSARADLRGGFTLSGFYGLPVLYRTVDSLSQADYKFQRDVIFGSRLGWRSTKGLELGLSYLQDGAKAAKDLHHPSATDYTRKQVGVDLAVTPTTSFDFRGRTVFDVASHRAPAAGVAEPSKLAEHDYTATLKLGGAVAVSGTFVERNFFAYFAGTNLPSLFRQDERDLFRAWGGKVTWAAAPSVQVVADYRRTHRETYGDANRAGADVRMDFLEKTVLAGVGAHWVSVVDSKLVDPLTPYRSLSHREARAWVLVNKGKLSASLDGIVQVYDSGNPYVVGLRNVYEAVGSLGYQATSSLKVSGDLAFGSNPVSKHETRGLLKAEYRFGVGKKGGQ